MRTAKKKTKSMQAQVVIAQNSVNCPSDIQLTGFQKNA
jgi:hypothetical protein